MIMKNGKQIGFIYKNGKKIDKIIRHGKVYFEQGFIREKTDVILPINFDGIGKNLKDYKIYGNTVQNETPTPDAPIDMVSCGDRTKNLYNYKTDNLNNSLDNLTVSLDNDGYLIINGTNNTNYRTPISSINITDLVEDGQTYTIFQEDITPSNITNNFSKVEVRFVRYKNNGTIEYPRTLGKHTARITIDKTNYIKYEINVVLPQAGDTYSNYKNRFMLLKGSYTDDNVPSYEPYYDGYKIPVNIRSDNLFDKNNSNDLLNNISINNTTSVISNANGFYTLRKDCKPNTTYTISKVVSSRFIVAYSNNSTYTSGEILLGKVSNNSATNLTITTGENAKSLYVFYSKLSDETTYTLQQILDSIMIVEGSTAPSKYIPYYNATTNIYLDEPLRKIDEYSDYIDFKNNKIIRNIDEIVLDGSESWGDSKITRDVLTHRFRTLGTKSHMVDIGFSDKFIVKDSETSIYDDIEIVQLSSATSNTYIGIKIYINRLSTNDIAGLTTWLSSNPVTIDYILTTPIEENIELPNISTIDGNNTLNIETELTPSQVYIKYKSNN